MILYCLFCGFTKKDNYCNEGITIVTREDGSKFIYTYKCPISMRCPECCVGRVIRLPYSFRDIYGNEAFGGYNGMDKNI